MHDYEQLTISQWAWEFLRRNPSYRSDYEWFINTWSILEQRYGSPPNRDYNAWKTDPLAWRNLEIPSTDQEDEPHQEALLIECWMGEKWGFYKFPMSPDMTPAPAENIAWRDPGTPRVQLLDNSGTLAEGQAALGFDLRLPLKPQINDAKKLLVVLQRQLSRTAPQQILSLTNCRQRWLLQLELLDALEKEKSVVGVDNKQNQQRDIDLLVEDAIRLRDGGYRELLIIPDK